MSTITIDCPDAVLRSLHKSGEGFAAELRLLAAVKLYELGKLSSGRAAELAGTPRILFLHRLAEHRVSLGPDSPAELMGDVTVARTAAHDRQ